MDTVFAFLAGILACLIGRCQAESERIMSPRLSAALLLGALLGACAAPEPVPDWDATVAGALAARAAELAAAGDEPGARRLADEALQAAREAGAAVPEGRARLVLARLDRSLDQARAARLLLPTPEERWPAALLEAELLLEADRPAQALARLEPLVAQAAASEDLARRGANEGPARHLAATALRRLERWDEARRHQRLALLALTLLPDEQLQPLRQAAAQARGDDLARVGDWSAAHLHHARAAALAEHLGDRDAQLAAQGARVDDLAGLGRGRDAAHLAAQRARLAHDSGRLDVARQAAQRGLHWCTVFELPADDPLRPELLALLRELDRLEAAAQPEAAGLPTVGSGQ